jgi:hypothetical protein
LYGLLQLTLLIETGVTLSGRRAILTPLRKKPKTLFYSELTYSLYSSDAKTYWNEIT